MSTLAELLSEIDVVDEGDVDAKLRALSRAVALRPPGLVKALRERAPQQKDPALRTAFVAALVRLGEDALLKEIARALRNADPLVVVGAARVLAQIGDRRAVPNLLEAFKTEDVAVGAAVAKALGVLGDAVAVPWLIAAAEQGFCVDSCAQALGAIGDARARPVLVKLAAAATEPKQKLALAQALHVFEERSG